MGLALVYPHHQVLVLFEVVHVPLNDVQSYSCASHRVFVLLVVTFDVLDAVLVLKILVVHLVKIPLLVHIISLHDENFLLQKWVSERIIKE